MGKRIMDRRTFLANAYRVGGVAALYSLGLSPENVHAFGTMMGCSHVATSGGSCDNTLYDNTSGTHSGDHDIGDADGYYYVGQTYNETVSRTICSVSFNLHAKAGDISGKSFYVHIAPRDSSASDADITIANILATSNAVTGSNSWSRPHTVEFTFATNPTIPANTPYAILVSIGGAVDAANYAEKDHTEDGNINGETIRFDSSGTFFYAGGKDSEMKIMYE